VRRTISRKAAVAGLGAAIALGTSLSLAKVALAVSAGPYSPPQQDCPWYAGSWNSPQNQAYPGCHNTQVSVESGGTTNGNPNNGWNNSPNGNGGNGRANTTWVQWGNDQAANDPNSQGTPTFYSLGEPGQSASPHAGCLAINSDGTKGGAVPEPAQTTSRGSSSGAKSTQPQSAKAAHSNQQYGCGNNPNGTGFDLNYNYYPLVCPLLTDAGVSALKCETYAGDDTDSKAGTPQVKDAVQLQLDHGGHQNLTDVATQGALLYFGMDDNSDNGEHDGEGPGTSKQTAGSLNGPSDGGAVMVALTPQGVGATPSLTHPEGVLNASTGFCADGNCADLTTQQETVYYGCGANTGENKASDKCSKPKKGSQRDAANYSGKQWDPYNCSSGGSQTQPKNQPQSDSPSQCNTSSANPSPSGSKNTNGGMDYWRQQEASQVNAEPGFQFYEDPDAEGSPAAPIYPNPAVYAGTCGVILGGGGTSRAGDPTGTLPNQSFGLPPGTPFVNSAGQIVISTGC